MQGISTLTCLSCMKIGTSVLGLEVSMTAELLLLEGILLATGVVTGVCGTMAEFTGVSGSEDHGHNDYFWKVCQILLLGSCQ